MKHYNIIKRRLEKGQCFRTPCFGCAEFPVRRIELVDDFDLSLISPEIQSLGDVDLGFMSYKVEFNSIREKRNRVAPRMGCVSGNQPARETVCRRI